MLQMGLGKTIQVIALIAYLVETRADTCRPALIVTPSSLTANWYANTWALSTMIASGIVEQSSLRFKRTEDAENSTCSNININMS